MSAVLDVILAVFDVTRVSNAAILFAFAVILAVFDAMFAVLVVIFALFVAMSAVLDVMLAVFDVTLVSNAAILLAFVVMLAVFDAMFAVLVVTVAGKVDIVEELTPPILFTVGKSAVPPKSFVNLSLPFSLEVASGVADPPTSEETNSVVAICVVLVPGIAVGAVGVPVKDGDAMVARNAMSAVLDVILAVFEVTRVSNAAILLALVVMLTVFDAMFAVLVVMFALFVAMSVVLDVILAVFEVTLVSNATILLAFVVMLAVFEVTLVSNAAILLAFVVMLAVFEVTLVSNATILLAFVVMLAVFDAIFAVLVVTVTGKVDIVEELTPPILFTVGKSAVPPKSFVNLSLPFTLEVASGVAVAAIPEATPELNTVCTN